MYEAFNISDKSKDKYKYLDENMIEVLGMYNEVHYNNEKDKEEKISKLNKRYDKVKVDVKSRKIICYNKANVNFTRSY